MPVPRIFAAQLTPREQWTHVLASVLALTATEHRAALLRDFTDEDLPGVDNTVVREQQLARLAQLKANRDEARCQAALQALEDGARGDGNLLALSIDQALDLDAGSREILARRARTHILRNFSLHGMCAATLDVYRSLIFPKAR